MYRLRIDRYVVVISVREGRGIDINSNVLDSNDGADFPELLLLPGPISHLKSTTKVSI
jgi:hypothetical protein